MLNITRRATKEQITPISVSTAMELKDDSISARVRVALTELLPAGICGIDEVASEQDFPKEPCKENYPKKKHFSKAVK